MKNTISKDVVNKLREIIESIDRNASLLISAQFEFHSDGRVILNLEYYDTEHL